MDVMSKKATHATSFSMFHLDYSFWKCSSLMKCVPFTTTDANGLLKFNMDCTPWAHIGNKGDNQQGRQPNANVNLILLLKIKQWMKGNINAGNIPLLLPCSINAC